jgi:hypothetical protein
VEILLAAVRDTTSYLHRISGQLEREVGEALDNGQQSAGTGAALKALEVENAQLRHALEGRAVIERAKGLLMALHHCDEDMAFQLLVTRSRQERRKLRAVSSEVLDRYAGAGAPPPAATQLARPRSDGAGRCDPPVRSTGAGPPS